jgi:hypothetical protein
MEARMSRYSSAEGPGSDVHASRVIAPDARDLTSGESLSHVPESAAFSYSFLTILTAMSFLARERRPWITIERESLGHPDPSYFFPQTAFRPPPIR